MTKLASRLWIEWLRVRAKLVGEEILVESLLLTHIKSSLADLIIAESCSTCWKVLYNSGKISFYIPSANLLNFIDKGLQTRKTRESCKQLSRVPM